MCCDHLSITTTDVATRNAADRALASCQKRSFKGFMTYDAAHAAWDTFVRNGHVPDGCSQPDLRDNTSAPFDFPRPNQSSAPPFHSAPSTPSRQHPLPDSALPLFNTRPPSQGFPQPSTSAQPVRQQSPTATRQRSTGPSTMSAKSPTFEDGNKAANNWWVVVTGAEPGVYYGRSVALSHLFLPPYISF